MLGVEMPSSVVVAPLESDISFDGSCGVPRNDGKKVARPTSIAPCSELHSSTATAMIAAMNAPTTRLRPSERVGDGAVEDDVMV